MASRNVDVGQYLTPFVPTTFPEITIGDSAEFSCPRLQISFARLTESFYLSDN